MYKYLIHIYSLINYLLYLIATGLRFPSRFHFLNKKFCKFRSTLLNNTIHKKLSSSTLIYHNVVIPYRLKIETGINVVIKPSVEFSGNGFVEIGNNSIIQEFSYIDTKGGLNIGNNTTIGKRCEIHTHNHLHTISKNELLSVNEINREVVIGDNVFIYNNVIILAGINICNFVVIGNSSVVQRNIEISGLYNGFPAINVGKI